MERILEVFLWTIFVLSLAGLIWRLFFVPLDRKRGKKKKEKGNIQPPSEGDISHLDLYKLLSAEFRELRGEIRWFFALNIGIWASLLGLIIIRL